jgi:hypothetical protein
LSTIWGRIELPTLQAGGIVDWVSLWGYRRRITLYLKWDYVLKAVAVNNLGFLNGTGIKCVLPTWMIQVGSDNWPRTLFDASFDGFYVPLLWLGQLHI